MSLSDTENNPSGKWNDLFSKGASYRDLNEAFILDLLDIFLDKNGSRPSAVVDLGCGNGITLSHFAKLNIPAFGIDFSEVGLRQAREYMSSQGLSAEFFVHDLNAFETFKADFPEKSLWLIKFVIAFIKDKKTFLHALKGRMQSNDVCLILTPILREGLVYTKEDKPGIAVQIQEIEAMLSEIFGSFTIFSNEYTGERTRVVGYLIRR